MEETPPQTHQRQHQRQRQHRQQGHKDSTKDTENKNRCAYRTQGQQQEPGQRQQQRRLETRLSPQLRYYCGSASMRGEESPIFSPMKLEFFRAFRYALSRLLSNMVIICNHCNHFVTTFILKVVTPETLENKGFEALNICM